jgi:hypothetical protein
MTRSALGAVLPSELTQARVELHWAAQLVSAAGTSLLPTQADFGHTNLGWDSTLGVLVGRSIGAEALRAALVFDGLELAVLDGDRERTSLRLAGRTVSQALAWLGRELAGDQAALTLPAHEMPASPVADGAAFSDEGAAARHELAVWFAEAFASISEVVAGEAAASPVRCWPHHFDVASLITLDSGADAEQARSIGVGFSPGDGSYDQPYFYVTPWPYPKLGTTLPALAAGAHWHTEGWTGAVLTAERVISVTADAQERTIRDALARGVAACRELLGA